ncbi:MAG: hypothetical protein ACP5TZ_03985 [Nitrososphaeria archaeon]
MVRAQSDTLSDEYREVNRILSSKRTHVEHPYVVIRSVYQNVHSGDKKGQGHVC